MKGQVVNRADLARLLGYSPRMIQKFQDEEYPIPYEGGGGRGSAVKYNTKEVIDWLIEREIRRRYGDDDDASVGDVDREMKLVKIQEIQRRLDREAGKILPIEAVLSIVSQVAVSMSSQIDAIASRMAAELAMEEEPAQVRDKLHAECRRIRNATADALCDTIREFSFQISEGS